MTNAGWRVTTCPSKREHLADFFDPFSGASSAVSDPIAKARGLSCPGLVRLIGGLGGSGFTSFPVLDQAKAEGLSGSSPPSSLRWVWSRHPRDWAIGQSHPVQGLLIRHRLRLGLTPPSRTLATTLGLRLDRSLTRI